MASVEQSADEWSRIRIQNRFSHHITLSVEPWGSTFPMEPGEVFDVVAQGPVGGVLELVVRTDYIAIWGWSGSLVTVYRDGERLDRPDDRPQPRVPAVPRR